MASPTNGGNNILCLRGEEGGIVGEEEGFGTEPPEDADAGDGGVAGGEDVNVAVADVDAGSGGDMESVHDLEDHVGRRLLANAFRLVLSHGYVDEVGEIFLAETLCGIVKLVAYYGAEIALSLQLGKHGDDARVGGCGILAMLKIVLLERSEDFLYGFL